MCISGVYNLFIGALYLDHEIMILGKANVPNEKLLIFYLAYLLFDFLLPFSSSRCFMLSWGLLTFSLAGSTGISYFP